MVYLHEHRIEPSSADKEYMLPVPAVGPFAA